MPGIRRSTTDAIFALRMVMEKYREGQKPLHCVFVGLEKAYDRVLREELWLVTRWAGTPEEQIRVVQVCYGATEGFEVGVGLHQGSVVSPFLFALLMEGKIVLGL